MKQAFIALALALPAVAGPALAADAPYKVLKTFTMPDGGWDYATSDFDRNLVYWVRNDHTDVIDANTGKVSSLKNTGNGHMAVVVPGTSLVVIPMRQPASTNRIVDAKTDTVVADVAGAGDGPDGATYDPFSKHVFSINHNAGGATEVDPIAKANVANIAISGGKLEFPASDGKGTVFVNVQAAGEIAVIDVREHKAVARWKMEDCTNASGLAYAAASNTLIASCGNGVAKVMNAANGREIATIPIGKGPDAVIYDARHKVAFIPCGASGDLEIIDVADAKKIKKIQTLKLPALARTGAVDKQGRLYMMAAEPDPTKPPGGGGRPTPKDGSFSMVVVGR